MVQRAFNFISSFTHTFLYFCLQPFQWLFFCAPKVYEFLLSIIIFIKNNIPTRTDFFYTIYTWFYYILKLSLIINILSLRLLMYIAKKIIQITNTVTKQLDIIIKKY